MIAYHSTLVSGQITVVTINTTAEGMILVLNRSGDAEIYFTINGDEPAVQGVDCYAVMALPSGLSLATGTGAVVVSLISGGSPEFSVMGI